MICGGMRDYGAAARATLATTTYRLGTSLGTGDKLQLEYYYSDTNNNGNLLSHFLRSPKSTGGFGKFGLPVILV